MNLNQSVVSCEWLLQQLPSSPIVVVDCRFRLDDPHWGRQQYAQSHIPSAVYLDLDQDLSGEVQAHGGRHPLPDLQVLAARLAQLGVVHNQTLVVAYDDSHLAFAARLWWLLRFMGHQPVAVLDGGWQAWLAMGGPVRSQRSGVRGQGSGVRSQGSGVRGQGSGVRGQGSGVRGQGSGVRSQGSGVRGQGSGVRGQGSGVRSQGSGVRGGFVPQPQRDWTVDIDQVKAGLDLDSVVLVDSRSRDRYLGLNEPIDPVAGSIPGAVNSPWRDVTDPQGFILPQAQQQQLWQDYADAEEIIVYCGSGVTACVNLLSLELAGFTRTKLYPGGWSDWCSYLI